MNRLKKNTKRLERYIQKILKEKGDKCDFYFLTPSRTSIEEKNKGEFLSLLEEKINPKFRNKMGLTITAVFEDENGGLWQNNFLC